MLPYTVIELLVLKSSAFSIIIGLFQVIPDNSSKA